MKKLWDLFITFFRIGAFTFGGGYAMLSLIDHACVDEKKWITNEDMVNVTLVAESTPGPVAINCATFVGVKQAGIPGAIAATLGVVLPSFVIIFAISQYLDRFLEFELIANAFRGIRVAVGILIVRAGLNMYKKSKKTPISLAVLSIATVLMLAGDLFALNVSTIVLMIASALVGIALYMAGEKKKEGAV